MALLFNHDTLHEGKPVTTGTKYIIRTEVMYRRVDSEMIPNPLAYKSDENYIKTLALYRKSWHLEQGTTHFGHSPLFFKCAAQALYDPSHTAGDSKGFTDTYLEAIKLQQQAQRSISQDSNEIFEQLLPYEVYMRIFGYLSAPDLCKIMTVCKVRSTILQSEMEDSILSLRIPSSPSSLSHTHTHTFSPGLV